MMNVVNILKNVCIFAAQLGILGILLNPVDVALADEASARNLKLEAIEKSKILSYAGPSASGSATYFDCNEAMEKDAFSKMYLSAQGFYPQVLPEPTGGDLYCTVSIGNLTLFGKTVQLLLISLYPKKELMMQCVSENKCGGDQVMIAMQPNGGAKYSAIKGDLLDNIVCMSPELTFSVKNRKENCEP